MFYNEIDHDIRPFLYLNENTFNSLPEDARKTLAEGARVQWLKAGAPKGDSIMYPIDDIPHQYITDLDDLTDYYYEHYTKQSTIGIDDHRFSLRNSLIKPSLSQFIDICAFQATKLNGTNAVISYIDNDDMIHHLSFTKSDLTKHTTDELVNMLKMGAEHWRDDGLYIGSDVVRDGFKTYRLNSDHFRIVVKHTRGGYGKMIAHYYDTLGLENNEDDCLIRCFIYIYKKEYPDLPLPIIDDNKLSNGKLGIDAVPLLEHLFNVKIAVCQDYHDVDIEYEGPETINLKCLPSYTTFKATIVRDEEIFIYGDETCKWKILYKDEHYDVIIRCYNAKQCLCKHTGELLPRRKPFGKKILRRKIIERYYIDTENLTTGGDSDTEDDKDVYYYFFDYETVFDINTMEIMPYAFAIVKCDNKLNVIDQRYKIGLDCNKDFSNYLFKETPDNHEIKYLIGYNNSRFDNFIMLKEAIKHDDHIGHVRFNGNTIISANVNDFKVRDLCRILNMSLDSACKAFKISMPKLTGAVSHHEVQFSYMNNHKENFSDYLMRHHHTIQEYVIRDCVCLAELYKVTKHTMMNLVNLNVNDHYTLAGMSYAAFKSIINVNELPILNNDHTAKDNFVRKAIIGGRSQMRLIKQTNMCAIDCVSLYPYVMLNREFPIGLPITTYHYIENKIGVYVCVIKEQKIDRLNIVPLRDKNERLNWDNKGEINCVLCSVDIECLKRHGVDVKIDYGIYWEKSKNNIFDHYFKNLIDEKKSQDVLKESNSNEYNAAVRETCKLLMNSLSGKLAQRIYHTETELLRDIRDVDRFFNKTIPGTQKLIPFGSKFIGQGKKQGVPNTPVIYGVLIYAYAREHMYESVLKYLNVDELYGMDTDSAFIREESMDKIPKHLFGSDFGQFKIELHNLDGIFIAPKCYCFYKDNIIVKARFKGVRVGKDIEEDGKCDLNNILDMYRYYHTKEDKVDLNTFNKLLTKGKIKIICCNINKSIIYPTNDNETALYLVNHVFIKEIIVKDNELCISNEDELMIDY